MSALFPKKGRMAPGRRERLSVRLRENLPFKIIALLLSAILYFFVQSERNPNITRTLVAQIVREGQPAEVAIETDQQQMMVAITGPRSLVERLKDQDIRAVADLKAIRATEPTTTFVRLNYLIQGQPPNSLLVLDPPNPRFKLQVYPPKTRTLPVVVQFPQEPTAGFVYGRVESQPKTIAVSGRADKVNRIARLVANAVPAQTGERIDGDFPVLARDTEGNLVEDVKLSRDTVHVTIPLEARPPQKFVLVSPTISALPLPPYRIESVTVTPPQVKVIGRPERLFQIGTITTEEISARDLTASQDLEVRLNVPSDVAVQDTANQPIARVRVRINVRKIEPVTPPSSGNTGGTSPGTRENNPD
jgi:YbbR domain-containing protein